MDAPQSIPGIWPAEVASYDGNGRTCRVKVPGITDGSSTLLEAVFSNPVGDRATDADEKSHTEIYIKEGDPVWVMFECGDPRFPVITGYRTPRTGNPTGWRRWKHANIELTADNKLIINAAELVFNVSGNVTENIGGNLKTDVAGRMDSTASASSHLSDTHLLTAKTTIAGAISTISGPSGLGVSMVGPVVFQNGSYTVTGMTVTFSGCAISSDGKRIDHTHTHSAGGAGVPN